MNKKELIKALERFEDDEDVSGIFWPNGRGFGGIDSVDRHCGIRRRCAHGRGVVRQEALAEVELSSDAALRPPC